MKNGTSVHIPEKVGDDLGVDPLPDRIAAEKTEARTELQRGDTKASYLLGFFGGVLGGIIALTRTGVSAPATVLLYLAAAPAAAAVVLLMLVILPRLGGANAGFTRHALFVAEPATLVDDLDRPVRQSIVDEAHHLAVLSMLALAKFQRIRVAVGLLLAALPLVALAVVVA